MMKNFLKKYGTDCIKIEKTSEVEYFCQNLGAVTLQK